MRSNSIKAFGLGAFVAYLVAAAGMVSLAAFGVLSVQADVAPSRLEAALFGSALHASVARRALAAANPIPPTEENLVAGEKVYRQMCSRCHGLSTDSDNTYGRSFYPPAPRLAFSHLAYTDNEMFWIVKHGIRNTAMPAWGNLLSDEEIWKVVTLLRKSDGLPDGFTP